VYVLHVRDQHYPSRCPDSPSTRNFLSCPAVKPPALAKQSGIIRIFLAKVPVYPQLVPCRHDLSSVNRISLCLPCRVDPRRQWL